MRALTSLSVLALLALLAACDRTHGDAGGRGPDLLDDTGSAGSGEDGGDGGGGETGSEGSGSGGGSGSGAGEGTGDADDTGESGTGSGTGGADDTGEWTLPERADTDSPGASDPWRHGGGEDYPDTVDPDWPVVTRVSTVADLESAVASAVSGDIIFVEGDAELDLTGVDLCIPAGVWLASDRGVDGSPGALLHDTETEKDPLIDICGDGVRITGLRILGADPHECPDEWPSECTGDIEGDSNCRDCTPTSIGIQTKGHDRLEIDNCELAGWSFAATWFEDGTGHHVHHSFIHHTWRQGLGYGVVLTGESDVDVLVAWNRFDANRHAIAGSGYPVQSYEARDNLVLEHANGHIFDMHGQDEREDDGSEHAGDELLVHDNTVLTDDVYSLVVRGKPYTGSWFYDNCLAASSSSTALQRFYTGNFHVDEDPSGASAPNTYGADPSDCESLRWCIAEPGVNTWTWHNKSSAEVDDLAVGDFDGDGVDDIFRTTGSEWRWSQSGSGSWSKLNASSYTLDQLVLADVTGDGKTDVIRAGSGGWSYSSGGSSSWTTLNSHSEGLDEVLWGDLDGDGAVDAFKTTGSQWQWSSGASGSWTRLNTSSIEVDQLALADLDGDGKADVFRASGSSWTYSSGGTSSWSTLASSSYTLSSLDLFDADGDGADDVVRHGSSSWWIVPGGSGKWERLRMDETTPDEALWGDFDGDGLPELFTTGCL